MSGHPTAMLPSSAPQFARLPAALWSRTHSSSVRLLLVRGSPLATLPASSAAPALLAEALVWGAIIVAGERVRRRQRPMTASAGAATPFGAAVALKR